MEKNMENNGQSEEIDLGYFFGQIGYFFRKCVKGLFMVLAFYIKYVIITIILIIVGFLLGFYLDETAKKSYINEVIVIPNFESADYLYSKVEEMNSKIQLDDKDYLKDILGKNNELLKDIKIEPIIDIYRYISQSDINLRIFEALSENQEMDEFLENMTTAKHYKYHKMTFSTRGENPEAIINAVLENFNQNAHFKKYQIVGIENTQFRIQENSQMIAQVDSIIKASISLEKIGNGQSVVINDNSWDRILAKKQEFLKIRLQLLQQQIDQQNIIKKVSYSYNITAKGDIRISRKILYPLLLILLFGGIFFVRFVYIRLKKVAEYA